MDVFLSYASEDRQLAERTCRLLETEGHDVFFDREDLGGGDAFNERIRQAVAAADVLVYLISRSSIAPGSYALTELSIASALPRRRRPAIVPVLIDDTSFDGVPTALRVYTIIEARGDVPAEIALAIDRIRVRRRQRRYVAAAAALLVVTLAAGSYGGLRWFSADTPSTAPVGSNTATPESATSTSTPADPVEAYNDAILARTAPDKRVSLVAMPGNNGWTAVLNLADLSARRVSYRIGADDPFTDTGSTGVINTMTGEPRPNTTIRIPGAFWDRHDIAVKYVDGKGVEHGPYTLAFDPRAEFARFTRQVLAAVDWVTFSDLSATERVAHFGTLVSYKAAFKEIRYSFNSAALTSAWPMKVDPSEGWPPRYADEQLYVAVPPGTTFITVRVTYLDGTMDTRRFDAPRR